MRPDAEVIWKGQRLAGRHVHGGIPRLDHSPGKCQRFINVKRSALHCDLGSQCAVVRDFQGAPGVDRDPAGEALSSGDGKRNEVSEGEVVHRRGVVHQNAEAVGGRAHVVHRDAGEPQLTCGVVQLQTGTPHGTASVQGQGAAAHSQTSGLAQRQRGVVRDDHHRIRRHAHGAGEAAVVRNSQRPARQVEVSREVPTPGNLQ